MRLMKRFLRRGQSGQSLVILAIGFIALVGFVGIVTDVSVLFVRYSTLRRAVDAAAVSAASQMRRIEDPTFVDANGDGYDDVAEDEAGSVTNLNLAARSFIELYGLNPKNVIVETCRAQQVARDSNGNPVDGAGVALFESDGDENPLADPEVLDRYQELCTEDELKLVRVTAQIEAPTMFLYLLGYRTVTLTESAISQTAVLDVVLILDVSESMLNQTTYEDWEAIGLGYRYMPPALFPGFWYPPDPINEDDDYDGVDEPEDHDAIPSYDGRGDGTIDYDQLYTGAWDLMLRNTQAKLTGYLDETLGRPWNANDIDPYLETASSRYRAFLPNDIDLVARPQAEPREECRIRAWPYSSQALPAVPAWLVAEYEAEYGAGLVSAHFAGTYAGTAFSGFVPMYDYYGCCNDPDGWVDADGNYSFDDLICQPFRQARDAAEDFLGRLDFTRGDRVAFVTFDRYAYLVDPDGEPRDTDGDTSTVEAGFQDPMIETERSFDVTGRPDQSRNGAVETLQQIIGVRAEPGTYVDRNFDGLWDGFRDDEGVRDDNDSFIYYDATDPGQDLATVDYATWSTYHSVLPIGYIHDQPVAGACPFDNAALTGGWTLMDDSYAGAGTLLEAVITTPSWFGVDNSGLRVLASYESRASCAGTNIGGGLAAGSQALFANGRTEGAVWIMVLLSDGAAGASDPMSRNGATIPDPPQPFNVNSVTGVADPQPAYNDQGYATYGLCPYGVQDPEWVDADGDGLADVTATVDSDGNGIAFDDGWAEIMPRLRSSTSYDSSFPYCGDRLPQTRHYCTNLSGQPNVAPLDDNNCYEDYDVDDYARDWADWVGLANLTGTGTGAGTGRVGEQQLPTIFTIGFGLEFDTSTGTSCAGYTGNELDMCSRGSDPATGLPLPRWSDTPTDYVARSAPDQLRVSEYLGEELLRYIADVGDNNRVDNDYWQQSLGGRIPNQVALNDGTLIASPDWGPRGACETETGAHGVWAPLPPDESCGNYFVADSETALIRVFNEIASRMFTRLSQ